MTLPAYQVNFDGMVGPTHNYAGLSSGNLASMENAGSPSHPKQAALEGLAKCKFLADHGCLQAVLPPHERPHLPTLRALGYSGTDHHIPQHVYKDNPALLFQYSSSASMFAANAATATPSVDAADNHVHLTPANKSAMPHRIIEAGMTARLLKAIFPSTTFFTHHPPLPFHPQFLDEGAANHIRFCASLTEPGVHFFVYGRAKESQDRQLETKYPPRQSLEAQQAIVRSHHMQKSQVVFAQQSADALNHGVFHNDVISMGTHDLFIYHESAFANPEEVIAQLKGTFHNVCGKELSLIEVSHEKIPLITAVKTYFFNSQIIKRPDGGFVLFCPEECRKNHDVRAYIENHLKDPESPIADAHFIELTQSMRNGGGPACLRLPVLLNEKELEAVNPNVFLTEKLYKRLIEWIHTHYREELKPQDLADPSLVDETQTALQELTQILDLGHIYDFQQ